MSENFENQAFMEQLEQDLATLDSDYSVYELHGVSCGLICGRGDQLDSWEWLSLITRATEAITQGDILAEEASKSLVSFYEQTRQALSDPQLQFYPLLPGDENDEQMLKQLALWASAWLTGWGLSEPGERHKTSNDVREFIDAMNEIARADQYELEGDETDEQAITELTEFIRIGVLLLIEEQHPSAEKQATMH
jgi:yecA family protein